MRRDTEIKTGREDRGRRRTKDKGENKNDSFVNHTKLFTAHGD